jgi:hypothetical protein
MESIPILNSLNIKQNKKTLIFLKNLRGYFPPQTRTKYNFNYNLFPNIDFFYIQDIKTFKE